MNGPEREPVIEVSDLCTQFGNHSVHRNLNLTVYKGEVMGLIGGSGSGKTALMHTIIGLLRPHSGNVRVWGENVHGLKGSKIREVRKHWGVLFQEGALYSALNVFDNVAFPLRELKKEGERISEASIRELVHLKLYLVGLQPDDAWKYPSELSGGMIKRVALARALAMEAELLFLDEPTTGLDPISANDFDSLFLELRRELRLTALMITHDLNSLAAVSDRVAVLDDGTVLAVGGLREVAELDHPYVKRFFRHRQGEEILRKLPSY